MKSGHGLFMRIWMFPRECRRVLQAIPCCVVLRAAESDIGQIKDYIEWTSFSALEYPSISTFRIFDISVSRGQKVGPLRYALKLGRRGAGITGAKGRNIGVSECRGSAEGSVSGSSVAWMEGRRKALVGTIFIYMVTCAPLVACSCGLELMAGAWVRILKRFIRVGNGCITRCDASEAKTPFGPAGPKRSKCFCSCFTLSA